MSVLFELDSGDTRSGAIVEILDLAQGLTERGIRCFVAGALTTDFERRAEAVGLVIMHARSRMFSRLALVPYTLSTLAWMQRLRRAKPTVVHLNYSTWGPSLACAAYRLSIPVVGRAVIGYNGDNPSNKWISAYVANSRAHAEGLLDSPLAGRVRIARTVIRLDRHEADVPVGLPVPPKKEGRVRFLCLGQLVERKGLDYLVRAAARTSPEAEFLLVGGDWSQHGYPSSIRALIQELKLTDRMVLMNHRSDVGALMRAADVFVLPSLSEARPRSIVEAMSFGLPVISTRVGAIPSLVTDHQNGLLVSPASADELTVALETLCRSPEMREQFGRAARATAEGELDANGAVEEHLDIYRQVMDSRAGVSSGRDK